MTLVALLFATYVSHYFEVPPASTESYHSAALYRGRFRMGRIRRFPRIKTASSWSGYFSARNFKTSSEQEQLIEYKKNIRSLLKNLPKNHVSKLKSLEVRNESHVSRGMANSKKIILNTGTIETEKELVAILVHEIGHIADLGSLVGDKGKRTRFYDGKVPILEDDPSYKYYRISWKDSKTRKEDSQIQDFVTGYAMSNVFEDFAEHYLFYRLHGEKFRKLAEHSEVLQAKYDFFKTYVFRRKEYQLEKESKSIVAGSIWDATLVDYDMREKMKSERKDIVTK